MRRISSRPARALHARALNRRASLGRSHRACKIQWIEVRGVGSDGWIVGGVAKRSVRWRRSVSKRTLSRSSLLSGSAMRARRECGCPSSGVGRSKRVLQPSSIGNRHPLPNAKSETQSSSFEIFPQAFCEGFARSAKTSRPEARPEGERPLDVPRRPERARSARLASDCRIKADEQCEGEIAGAGDDDRAARAEESGERAAGQSSGNGAQLAEAAGAARFCAARRSSSAIQESIGAAARRDFEDRRAGVHLRERRTRGLAIEPDRFGQIDLGDQGDLRGVEGDEFLTSSEAMRAGLTQPGRRSP